MQVGDLGEVVEFTDGRGRDRGRGRGRGCGSWVVGREPKFGRVNSESNDDAERDKRSR